MFQWLVACGGPEPVDPRAGIRARLGEVQPTASAPEDALRLGRVPEACLGFAARAGRSGTDEDWRGLLVAAARHPPGTVACLPDADGDALAAWATAEAWRGARAEWSVHRGDIPGALALLAEPGHDDARLRVLLAAGEGDRAILAAEGALILDPRDALACRVVAASALEHGDLHGAIEESECSGARSPELSRLRAAALDRAGQLHAAEAAFRDAGADVHLAALLYQEEPRRWDEAEALLGAPTPPAALHRGWLAHVRGREASLDGLDASFEADILRAVTRLGDTDAATVARLDVAPGAVAAVARARVAAARRDDAGMEAALARALAASGAAEPVHRARVALRRERGGAVEAALRDWEAQDPDHVRLAGARGSRDAPWSVVAPWSWRALGVRPAEPKGTDAVGEAWRAAIALPDRQGTLDALAQLWDEHPELEALPGARYPFASGSLDAAGSVR